jgi:uncharacterized protein (DUF362 family)
MALRSNRRTFLRNAALGLTGAALTPAYTIRAAEDRPRLQYRVPRIFRNPDTPSRAAIVKGNDRKQNMLEALALIKDDIKAGIGDKQVIIKVNFTSSLLDAGTHVDVIRAICETITPFYKKPIIVTEGQGGNNPIEKDWESFGYYALEKEFNVELRDEWDEHFGPLTIIDHNYQPLTIPVCESWRDPNTYMISAAVLKRHRTAVVTLSLKNVLMASIWNHDGINCRRLMHVQQQDQTAPIYAQQFQLNQYFIGMHTAPDLAVIDGFAGMEIEELRGALVDSRLALVSTDFLAADRVGAALMDVDFSHIGALNHCYNANMGEADLRKIDILGHSINECKKTYGEEEMGRLQRLHWKPL